MTDIFRIFSGIVLRWLHQTSLMISQHWYQHWLKVMACCRQATSHYLSQCWYRTKLPNLASLGHNDLTHCDLVMLYAAVDHGSEYGRRLKSTPPVWELFIHCRYCPIFLSNISFKILHWWKCISKYCLQNGGHFVQALNLYETTNMSRGKQDINFTTLIHVTAGKVLHYREVTFSPVH